MDNLDGSKEDCILCGKDFEMISISKYQERLFTAWRTDCVDTVVRLLGLGTSSVEMLQTARCCPKCIQLIRDIDFLSRTIQSFQSHLGVAQSKLQTLFQRIEWKELAVYQSNSSTSIPVTFVGGIRDEEEESNGSIKEEPQTPPPAPTYLHRKRKLAQILRGKLQLEHGVELSRPFPSNCSAIVTSKIYTNDFESNDQNSEESEIDVNNRDDDGSEDDPNFDPLAPYEIHQPSSTLSESDDREDTDDQEWTLEIVNKNGTHNKLRKRNEVKKVKLVKHKYGIPCTFAPCRFQCKKTVNLDVHVRSVHLGDPTPYHCTSCKENFRSYYLLHSHRKCHEIVDEEKKPLICPVIECSQQFPYNQRRLLYKHMKLCHVEERLRCQFCGFTFLEGDDGKIKMGQHETKHQEHSVPFSCVVSNCDVSFTNSFDLKKHVLHEHADDGMNVCEMCPGKVFKSPRSLYDHKSRVHFGRIPEKQHKCMEAGCYFVGRYKSDLAVHLRRHREDRPYMCDECGSTFKAEATLKRHKFAAHTGETPYKCTYCSKSFNLRQKLRDHEETHAPNLTYLCAGCGKAFRCRKNLNQHAKCHCPHKLPSQTNPMKPPPRKRKPRIRVPELLPSASEQLPTKQDS